jgi:hypothetical protein
MRSVMLAAVILISCGRSTSAADSTVACPLLTQAQVAAATGATVGAGSPIAAPTSCQWAGQGKIVTLTIRKTLAGKRPVEQFNDSKARALPGITVEPVSGVGDDAFYVYFAGQNRAGCGLVVKKGTGVFEVRVYGFDLGQAKSVSKMLAQQVATNF